VVVQPGEGQKSGGTKTIYREFAQASLELLACWFVAPEPSECSRWACHSCLLPGFRFRKLSPWCGMLQDRPVLPSSHLLARLPQAGVLQSSEAFSTEICSLRALPALRMYGFGGPRTQAYPPCCPHWELKVPEKVETTLNESCSLSRERQLAGQGLCVLQSHQFPY
jgi:hypothetical protein